MTAQHTPGPYFVSGCFIGPRLSNDSGIQIQVARVAGDETDPEVIANARLIAAAPDMLAALEILLPCNLGPLPAAQFDEGFVVPVDMTAGEIRIARAAIAKARGQ